MDRRIIEGIEACRPGSDDLLQGDMSDVARAIHDDPRALARYQRVQAWDAVITDALDQVVVPEGLDGRILDRLQASQVTASSASAAGDSLPNGGQTIAVRWRRRRWLTAAAGIAAALFVAAWLGDWLSPRGADSLEQLAERLQTELAASSEPWHTGTAHRAFPVPAEVNASPTDWHAIANLRGVAYRVRNNTGVATLFVLKRSAAELPTVPPLAPQSTTGGKSVAYWQKGALLYVLVVEGDQRRYRSFVSTAPVPVV